MRININIRQNDIHYTTCFATSIHNKKETYLLANPITCKLQIEVKINRKTF